MYEIPKFIICIAYGIAKFLKGDRGQVPVPSLKIKNLQNIPSIAA